MTWQPYGRAHILHGSSTALVIEHAEGDPYRWSWAIWVSVNGTETLLRSGTHSGTEAGAKQAVADALRTAAANLTNDARAAAVVRVDAPEVGA